MTQRWNFMTQGGVPPSCWTCLEPCGWRLVRIFAVSSAEHEMAKLVAAAGVPHSPHYPRKIAKDGPDETARLYREVAATLASAKPDAIVIFANDHFNTFF